MQRRTLLLGTATAALIGTATEPRAERVNLKEEAVLFRTVKQINAGVLSVGYFEAGPKDAPVVVLLHGFPYDVLSFVEVGPSLVKKGYRVIVPYLRGHGTTNFLDPKTPRSGQQAAIGRDLIELLDALEIKNAIFAGYDWGGRAACVGAALWPERCNGLVSVNSYLIQDIAKANQPAPAHVERGFWYQFYFQTERGRKGLARNRTEIARIMWHENSPTWRFDNETFERSARSFENPDYVDVVVHSYRHRLGGAKGYPDYNEIEAKLAIQPVIQVPSVTLDGAADGVVSATDGTATAAKFGGKRVHRVIPGVGHNLPQEAPSAFIDAVIEVASL